MPSSSFQTSLLWAHLNVLTLKRYEFLKREFESLEEAWTHLDAVLLKTMGCRRETISQVLDTMHSMDAENIAAHLAKENIEFITIEDEAYPAQLRALPDPPVFLFLKGNGLLLRRKSIGIVGTRAMSSYGKRCTDNLVTALIQAGLTTVSGLAIGVDAEVAIQTINAGGKTIAVLGHGLGTIYPTVNAQLAKTIVANGGLLLSEFPPHVKPDTYTFPARNRIIAGLSLGTVVVEAAAQSGSLITASLALEYGREVFAIPGQIFDPNFAGTHALIRQGATLIRDADDIFTALGMVAPGSVGNHYEPKTTDESSLFENLNSMPQSVNELVEKTGLPANAVNAALTLMEVKQGAKHIGAGTWVRA